MKNDMVGDLTKEAQKQLKRDAKVARRVVKAFMRLARRGRKMSSAVHTEVVATLITKKKLRPEEILTLNDVISDVITGRSLAVSKPKGKSQTHSATS